MTQTERLEMEAWHLATLALIRGDRRPDLRAVEGREVTKPYTPLTEYQLSRLNAYLRVRCDLCDVWVDVDDIVWRGPDGTEAICDECHAEGDR